MKKSQSTLFQTWNKRKTAGNNLSSGESHCTSNCLKQNADVSAASKTTAHVDIFEDVNADIFDEELVLSSVVKVENNNNDKDKNICLESVTRTDTKYEKILGFDEQFGNTYIYPTNYPVRDYQFNIIQKALLRNTMVVLPTGLGKTFIAAVVMYNFYRWYPQGKIIFMAPTKPLVAQQINACYKIMGIPHNNTAEMTGSMNPQRRAALWKSKRVFFLTPQVMQNDLARGTCCAPDVVCLVFDEAHRALGNHAYCQVVKDVMRYKSNFRVLALSATPGDDMKAVQQVINNLLIAKIEIRSEDSIDIQKYIHERKIEKIVVPVSGDLKKTKISLMKVLDSIVQRLYSKRAIWQSDAEKVSKYVLILAREQWRSNNANTDRVSSGLIEGDFALLISLYHSLEVLMMHGILSFYIYMKGILAGTKGTSRGRNELNKHHDFMELMEDLHAKIEGDELNQTLNQSIMAEKNVSTKQRLLKTIPKTKVNFQSHPKLQKLEEVVLNHFRKYENEKSSTRIMIFSQYRDSVQEITSILSRHEPIVKPMSFVGQGSKEGASGKTTKGLSQKEQLEIMRRFRDGGYNTVISTSVGEEGLDIGEVDLIICFDVSSSPIRLVQRMGRTGRKRKGKIVVLVTEGKEESTYRKSLSNKKGIHKNLVNAANSLTLYDENPRMIPRHLNPQCYKMSITIPEEEEIVAPKQSKSSSTSTSKSAFKALVGKQASNIDKMFKKGLLSDVQKDKLQANYYGDQASCRLCKQLQKNKNRLCSHLDFQYPLSLFEWRNWQTSEQSTVNVNHSGKTKRYCKLMAHFDNMKDISEFSKYEKTLKENQRFGKFNKQFSEKKNQIISIEENCDSDFDDFELKRPAVPKLVENLKEEKLKPCSFEELFEEVSNSLKLKKQKPRLTKLPKIERKSDAAITIEDNQLDFCSQVTMDTLFNRCQQKRRSSYLDLLQESDEKENFNTSIDLFVNQKYNESNQNNYHGTLLDKKHSEKEISPMDIIFKKPQKPTWSENIEKNHKDEELFPLCTQAKDLQKRKKVCVVSPLVNTLLNNEDNYFDKSVPEPPSDFAADSILDADEKKLNLNNDKVCDSEVFTKVTTRTTNSLIKEKPYIAKKNSSNIQCNISANMKDNRNAEQKCEKKIIENDVFDNHSFFELFDNNFDDACMPSSSPPMISQAPIKTKFKSPEKQKDQSIFNCDDMENIFINSPPIFNKSLLDDSDNEDSPLFKRNNKRKVGILDSQPQQYDTEDSDGGSFIQVQKKRRKKLQENNKKTSKKKTVCSAKEFLDMEAEEDDMDGPCDVTMDITTVNGYVKDSFINDDTIDTPFPREKKGKKQCFDMNAVYKQSLMSPNNGILQFRTPAFKANRNRYKLANLAEKYASTYDSGESSEAEEVMGLVDSDIEEMEFNKHESNVPRKHVEDNQKISNKTVPPEWCHVVEEDELPPLTFSFCVEWPKGKTSNFIDSKHSLKKKEHTVKPLVVENIQEHSKKEMELTDDIVFPLVAKKSAKEKIAILMDSRCMNNPEIASILRASENYETKIVPQLYCDFVVSQRCGVFRRTVTDISNTTNMQKFITCWQSFNEMYSLCYLIIENDRVKSKQLAPKPSSMTNYFAGFLAKLSVTNIQIIYSKSQEDTCTILKKLSTSETGKGFGIKMLNENKMSPTQKQMMTSLQCIPKVTYPVAVQIVQAYESISEIVNSSLVNFKSKLKYVRQQTLAEIYFFFQRRFDVSMLGSSKL